MIQFYIVKVSLIKLVFKKFFHTLNTFKNVFIKKYYSIKNKLLIKLDCSMSFCKTCE